MFSGSRTQKSKSGRAGKGILRVAREGATRDRWICAALDELLSLEGVERAGVWLEEAHDASPSRAGVEPFRGEVWDRDGEALPVEWNWLGPESPVPAELLQEKNALEYDTEWSKSAPVFGPLVGLSRVLWIPIIAKGIVRGLLLAGSSAKVSALPRAPVERVSVELGFLLEIEEERLTSRAKQSDLDILQRVSSQLALEKPFVEILAEIAAGCAKESDADGPCAIFTLIGELLHNQPVATPSAAANQDRLGILAQSGESAWAYTIDDGPLEMLWRRALQDRELIIAETDRLPLAKDVAKLVAIPLGDKADLLGVFIAGIPRDRSGRDSIGRLELRARLAAAVLRRSRAEAAERARLNLNNALLELSGGSVLVIDRDGVVAGMSRGARELVQESEFRYDATEYRRFAQLFRPRDWEEVDSWLTSGFTNPEGTEEIFPDASLRAGKPVRLCRIGSFKEQFVLVRIEPVDPGDHVHSLEEAEEEFQQVVAWLEEGVAVFDTRGHLRAHNLRFRQLLGLQNSGEEDPALRMQTLEDLIRRTKNNAANPEEFAAAWRALACGNHDGVKEEIAMERPFPQLLERCTKALIGKYGCSLGRVEVYREMRSRNQFESRMAQTEKLASLGQRVTGIVHELNNPITNILLLSERLARRRPPTAEQNSPRNEKENEQEVEVRQILLESGRASAILRQMLDLTRERRKERRLISLNEVVTRSVEVQRAMLSGTRITLHVAIAENLSPVEGDFSQLQQVLLNLLQNAQQAIEQGGQGSRIEVRTAREGTDRVRLEVEDDGPGIPASLQANIFDPFFTTKPPGVGTGLGLSIVLGFVRQHGGTVWTQMKPTGGAKFIVELPAANHALGPRSAAPEISNPANALTVAYPQSNGLKRTTENLSFDPRFSKEHFAISGPDVRTLPRCGGHGHKVLVIEDEPTVAGLIADVLREEGMQVDVLSDGSEALLQAGRKAYDLAICDLKMPGTDGQEFYRGLRVAGNALVENVLFITGDILAARTQKFLEENGLSYLAKPFRMEELMNAVRGVLWRGGNSGAGKVKVNEEPDGGRE